MELYVLRSINLLIRINDFPEESQKRLIHTNTKNSHLINVM